MADTIEQLYKDSGLDDKLYPITKESAVKDDNNVSLNTKLANNYTQIINLTGSIAVEEVSPSTRAYAVNDYLMYNNQLYKVTSAIAIGDELSSSNISATTVMAEILSMLS